MHLHHRLLAIGHSQRRAVILMYVWTAVLAFPCALLVVLRGRQVLIILVVAVLLAALATFGFARHRVRPGAPAGGGEPRPAAPAGPAHARPVEPAAAPAAGGTSPAPAWRPVPESGSFGTEPPPPGVTGGEGVR
jgi:UDP-GlcNAc:undecaprenyl-phosphate GlcNAc-1-phosphate transferase